MHNFWYNSPVKFTAYNEDFKDVLNPQNIQFFGLHYPYELELGVLHRFLLPDSQEFDLFDSNIKLYVYDGSNYTEIPSQGHFEDTKLIYVTFKCDLDIRGQLVVEVLGNKVLISNCIHFTDTSINSVKQLRIIARNNYNRQKFDYTNDNAYFVTNIPAYERGLYHVETDITNERNGGNATLKIQETYLDEVVKYEFDIRGNNDILNFIGSATTNTEFYINGTKRTLKENLELDDLGFFAFGSFVNEKDESANNITIDENVVFNDLELKVIETYPFNGSVVNLGLNTNISVRYNKGVSLSDKSVKVYKDNVLVNTIPYTSLVLSENNTLLTIDNLADYVIGVYRVEIPNGVVFDSFNNQSKLLNINFSISNNGYATEIRWQDSTITDKVGDSSQIKVILNNNYFGSPTFWQVDNGSGFNNFAPYISGQNQIDIALNFGINKIRLASNFSGTDYFSNVLQYTRNEAITPNLIAVERVNNTTAKFKWNNGADISATNITFQMSLEGFAWFNLGIYSTSGSLDNIYDVVSTYLLNIPNGTIANFRIKYNENLYTNIVRILWLNNGNIYISNVNQNASTGITTYDLNITGAPFIGYCTNSVMGSYNCRFGSSSVSPFGIDLSSSSPETLPSNYQIVNIPVGVYNCSIYLSATAIDFNEVCSLDTMVGYGTTSNKNDSIATVSAFLNI